MIATADTLDSPSSLARARCALARLSSTTGGLLDVAEDLAAMLDPVALDLLARELERLADRLDGLAEVVTAGADPGRLRWHHLHFPSISGQPLCGFISVLSNRLEANLVRIHC